MLGYLHQIRKTSINKNNLFQSLKYWLLNILSSENMLSTAILIPFFTFKRRKRKNQSIKINNFFIDKGTKNMLKNLLNWYAAKKKN